MIDRVLTMGIFIILSSMPLVAYAQPTNAATPRMNAILIDVLNPFYQNKIALDYRLRFSSLFELSVKPVYWLPKDWGMVGQAYQSTPLISLQQLWGISLISGFNIYFLSFLNIPVLSNFYIGVQPFISYIAYNAGSTMEYGIAPVIGMRFDFSILVIVAEGSVGVLRENVINKSDENFYGMGRGMGGFPEIAIGISF